MSILLDKKFLFVFEIELFDVDVLKSYSLLFFLISFELNFLSSVFSIKLFNLFSFFDFVSKILILFIFGFSSKSCELLEKEDDFLTSVYKSFKSNSIESFKNEFESLFFMFEKFKKSSSELKIKF